MICLQLMRETPDRIDPRIQNSMMMNRTRHLRNLRKRRKIKREVKIRKISISLLRGINPSKTRNQEAEAEILTADRPKKIQMPIGELSERGLDGNTLIGEANFEKENIKGPMILVVVDKSLTLERSERRRNPRRLLSSKSF